MATTIVRDPRAFTGSGGKKKRPREHDKAHLDFIRSLPCLVTGKRPVEAAHLRYPDLRYGKTSVGMGEKPDDRWTVPLHRDQHRDQHAAGDERGWWASHGIDPVPVAMALSQCGQDEELALEIIRSARNPERT